MFNIDELNERLNTELKDSSADKYSNFYSNVLKIIKDYLLEVYDTDDKNKEFIKNLRVCDFEYGYAVKGNKFYIDYSSGNVFDSSYNCIDKHIATVTYKKYRKESGRTWRGSYISFYVKEITVENFDFEKEINRVLETVKCANDIADKENKRCKELYDLIKSNGYSISDIEYLYSHRYDISK